MSCSAPIAKRALDSRLIDWVCPIIFFLSV
jgi:hypothetical protein